MSGPHQDRPLVTGGAPLAVADAAAVLLHGRGATAEGIVALADEFYRHGLALVAPQAERNRWYPDSFLAPTERNEPWLSSGLEAVADAVEFVEEAGVPKDRTLVAGISQGGCLAAEFLARTPARYGGAAVLSGGLMGPDVDVTRYAGSLEGAPVLVGCSDDDEYVPLARVRETAAVFERLDGDVTERIYEGLGHGANDDELAWLEDRVEVLLSAGGVSQ
ncbi:alpha/beta hydrolase [Natronomonas salina]|uniref:alpha/beta hydrolase n=1 Tax=Natronomonas salina TaxID=1710540 RepID=UPI001BAA87AE|nr:dienelactone hydrolase family protein [Natronomonas salina]